MQCGHKVRANYELLKSASLCIIGLFHVKIPQKIAVARPC